MWPTRCCSFASSRNSRGALILICALLQGCSAGGRPNSLGSFTDGPAVPDGTTSRPVQVKIYLDTYGRPLGAFDLKVHYSDDVGKVLDQEPPEAAPYIEFFKWRRSKHTTYIHVEGFFSKTGPIEERQLHVASMVFHREGSGKCDLKVEVVAAYDPDGKDMKSAVTAHANPPLLYFR